jgi:hypothetical protein
MTDPTPTTRRSTLHSLAVVLSSLLIAFPVFVSSLVKAATYAPNPANVDITNDLAYLREILGFGFGSLGLLLVAIVVVYVLVYRRERTLDGLKLPLLILAVQIVAGVATLLFNAISDNARDTYVGALIGF